METAGTPLAFFSGAPLWRIASIAMIFSFGGAFKNTLVGVLAGFATLLGGVAFGAFSPLLVLLIVLEGASAVLIFAFFKQ